MLLKPQHLQQQDTYFEQSLKFQTTALRANEWGFVKLVLDESLLALNQISISQASGKFADGTLFNIPSDSVAPSALPIESMAAGQWVYLALPITPAGSPLFSMDNHHLSRFWSYPTELTDNSNPDVQPEKIYLARLNLTLMQADRSPAGYLSLPVLELDKFSNGQGISVNSSFLPPCFDIRIADYWLRRTQGLQQSLQAKIARLIQSLNHHPSNYGLTQAIQSSYLKIQHLFAQPLFHPESLYLVLLELLSSLSITQRQAIQLQYNYNHQSPGLSLNDAFTSLEQWLAAIPAVYHQSIPLNAIDAHTWQTPLLAPTVLQGELILSITLSGASALTGSEILSHIKVSAPEMLDVLLSQALPGIELIPIKPDNASIQVQQHRYYYRINTQSKLWHSVRESRRLVIHATDKLGPYQPSLWANKQGFES